MSKALLINREDLVRFTPLSGNMDFDKVIQYVEIAQDIHVHELLGTKLYERIQSDIIAGTLSGSYADLVSTYVKPILAQYSLLEYLPFSQYTINNKGVFKHTSENSNAINKDDMESMTEATRDTAQHYAKRMIDYICANPTLFSEYLTNNNGDIKPVKKSTFGGWHI